MNAARQPKPFPAEQHFACTLCGQCCYGVLPLTLGDAFANAGRFPLAMLWTPVPQGTRAFELTAALGTSLEIAKRKRVAISIMPTAYVPSSVPCPALAENRCSIQDTKPLRCLTMPFYAYRPEADQGEHLIPRKGWTCDVSDQATLIYRDRQVLDRTYFDAERAALIAQAPLLRHYADTTLKRVPALLARVQRAAQDPGKGGFALPFLSFLRLDKELDTIGFAKAQHPVLSDFAERTTGDAKLARYHGFYNEAAIELEWFARRE